MATETESSFTNRDAVPSVTQDARFRAGQKLKQSGRVHLGAIHMFEILADRAEDEFGITSIETAAVYYELGHSIFLNLTCHRENSTDPANEERSKANTLEDALEYMAKSCSILYAHGQNHDQNHDNDDNDDPPAITASTKYQYQYQNQYQEWARDQIPRVLIGIGNIQSYQHKHADAIDSYMNAVPYREAASDACRKETHQSSASLKRHRLFAESHVLIAEELLISMAYYSPSPPSDLVHSETGLIIVKADQVTTLAKTYYEQGKEKLQDIGK
jgi:hypothetical protein